MMKRGFVVLLLILVLCLTVYAQVAWDEDEDGFCSSLEAGCPEELDCNDNNPMINPDAEEILNDLDDDCNGLVDDINVECQDSDLDGYSVPVQQGADCGIEDCNDVVFSINPEALEVCDDSIDNDCDDLVDDEDPDCIVEEDLCQISADFTGLFGCESFPQKVSSAYDGDTVWMILWTDNCDEQSSVNFELYEYSEGLEPLLIDSFEASYTMMNIDYGDGPTNEDVWAAPWTSQYFEDDDGSDPEFYFEARLVDSQGFERTVNSGMELSEMLTVAPCPDGSDYCPVECVEFGSEFRGGEEFNDTCAPDKVDCSQAPWSQCNEVTKTKTRDVSKCIVYGVSESCEAEAKSMLPDEQACTPVVRPSVQQETEPEPVCGDGYCDEGEDCPEDCEEPSGSWWIFILIIIIVALGSGAFYLIKNRMKKAKPKEEKKELFANEKDEQSVMTYINAARKRGYTDAQINVMLTKGGWKADQIKHAFSKVGEAKKKSPFKVEKDEKAVMDYAKNAKKKGYTDDQVKDALLKSGRSKEQVDYIFKNLK